MARSIEGVAAQPRGTADDRVRERSGNPGSVSAVRALLFAFPPSLTEAVTHQLAAVGIGTPDVLDASDVETVCRQVRERGVSLILIDLRDRDEIVVHDVVRTLHAARPGLFVVGLVDDSNVGTAPPEPDRTLWVGRDDLTSFVMWETVRDLIGVTASASPVERVGASTTGGSFRRIVEASPDGQIVLNDCGDVVFQNPAAEALVGIEDIDALIAAIRAADGCSPLELTLDSGRTIELAVVETTWENADARLVTLHDCSRRRGAEGELRRLNTQLREMAHTDALTGVLNRRGLESVLVTQTHDAIAILFDLDDFSDVNDAFGYAVGDAVLRAVATTLRELSRPTDFVCRLGGDEFLVLMSETEADDGVRLAEHMRLAIAACPIKVNGEPVQPTVTIGVAPIPRTVRTAAGILTATRMTLSAGKANGKNCVGVSDQEQAINTIVQQLYRGDGLTVVAQSIVNLATNRVVGYELLSRGPRGVAAMPREFFRLCVEHGILHEVDLACLRNGVIRAQQLDSRLNVHLNLFPSTVNRIPVDEILRILNDADGRRFCIELTEKQMMVDFTTLRDRLRVLQSAGICVAIDDVGAGSSSLESLLTLRPDVAKIDRAAVQGVVDDPDRRRALEKLVDVIRVLESEPVAEGVECEETARFLRDIGVNYAQGYLWGRPE